MTFEARETMLTDIVVNFTTDGRKLRAIVPKGGNVKGVLLLDEEERTEFAVKNGLTRVKGNVPAEVKVKNSKNQTVTLAAGEVDGPQVCYWVGSNLVCW
jgi:hypothetical protein